MFSRFAEDNITTWLRKERRKPLVLRGARQVGKSTLVREIAQKNNLTLCEVNLERHMDLDEIFATLDLDLILREIEGITGTSPNQPDTVLFLDEIQATPQALRALRYFYEDLPGLPVLAAGSLLEFALAEVTFSMPVGRLEYFHLGPMTFKEFLLACEPSLCRFITIYDSGDTFPASIHKKLISRYREYLFAGGMPEALQVYHASRSLEEVAAIHRSIADTYQDDFAKYARGRDLALLQRVLNSKINGSPFPE